MQSFRLGKHIAYVYLIVTMCLWGSIYVVSKLAMDKIPPLTILFFRYFIALLVLLLLLRTRPKEKIAKADYKYIGLIGFLGYFLSIGVQLIGIQLSSASVASLISSMNPILIILFASIILKEKLTKKKIVCMCTAILGSYVVLGGGSAGGVSFLGALFSVIAVCLWALSSVLARRVAGKYDPIRVTTYAMIVAVALSAPVCAAELAYTPKVAPDIPAVIAVVYIGVFCTGIAHLLWNQSLSMLEAGTCSLLYPVQPVSAILLAALFLGETITPRFVLGAVLILSGILLSFAGNPAPDAEQQEAKAVLPSPQEK